MTDSLDTPMSGKAIPAEDSLVLVRRDMLASACAAIRLKKDAPATLESLRAASLANDAPAQASGVEADDAIAALQTAITKEREQAKTVRYLLDTIVANLNAERVPLADIKAAWASYDYIAKLSSSLPPATGGVPVAWRYRIKRWHDGNPGEWSFTDCPELWNGERYEVQALGVLTSPSSETGAGVGVNWKARYEWLRDWYLRGGLRAEIHELGHIVRTTPEIFDAGVDARILSALASEGHADA